MSQKEKEIFEAQLMKEAEIRDRLKEVRRISFFCYNDYKHFLVVTGLPLTLGKSIGNKRLSPKHAQSTRYIIQCTAFLYKLTKPVAFNDCNPILFFSCWPLEMTMCDVQMCLQTVLWSTFHQEC